MKPNLTVLKSAVLLERAINRPPLRVQRLHPKAKFPTVSHAGEDLGYDIYALEGFFLREGTVARIPTGIALELEGFGFLLRDRSSLALQGVTVSGGVIDSGYRGEIFVNLTWHSGEFQGGQFKIEAGQKIAQLIPVRPETHFPIVEVERLSESLRGDNGYGSTGR